MSWRKLGLVYAPSGEHPWARSHAHLPTPFLFAPDRLRVYYAGLDADRFGRIGFVDVDARHPTRILATSSEPSLDLGPPGSFDDSGVNPSCVIRVGDRLRLYYIGWQRCERVPYMLYAGIAESSDGIHFERLSPVPMLDRTRDEPYLRSATSVHEEEHGYRGWYVSALNWTTVGGQLYPEYVVRMAESKDGLSWSSGGPICIPLQEDEFGIGRPWVKRDPDCYRMWYSIRSHSRPYRLGYAESADGVVWQRHDDRVGLEVSPLGWDSEMICYPAIVEAAGQRYLFYNGNQHGLTGFGCAVWETEA
jgi:hypothetical protein